MTEQISTCAAGCQTSNIKEPATANRGGCPQAALTARVAEKTQITSKDSPPAHEQSRPAPRLRHRQHTISLGQHLVSDTVSTRSVSASTSSPTPPAHAQSLPAPGKVNVLQGWNDRGDRRLKAPSTQQTGRRPSRRDGRRRALELHPVAYRSGVPWTNAAKPPPSSLSPSSSLSSIVRSKRRAVPHQKW